MTSSEAKSYEFREDYVTVWTPIWERLFAGLRGARGLRILEIGSFEGRSTIWFLENLLTADDASILCVDPFASGTEALFDKNILLSGAAAKVTKIRRRSDDFLSSRPEGTFDLIYIDGSHQAPDVLFDGMLSFPLLASGGILMFDDYEWEQDLLSPHLTPQVAIDLCLDAWTGKYDLLHKEYQVILRKR